MVSYTSVNATARSNTDSIACFEDTHLSLIKGLCQYACVFMCTDPVDSMKSALEEFLKDCQLPCLKSLNIGFTNSDDDSEALLIKFLIAHPLIEKLSLPFDRMNDSFTRLEGDLITPDMLPNLRTLACHITILQELVRRGVRSITNLTSLSMGHSMEKETVIDISRTLSALYDEASELPIVKPLKPLHFEAGVAYKMEGHYGAPEARNWMLILLFPTVVHYLGFLPDTTSVSMKPV